MRYCDAYARAAIIIGGFLVLGYFLAAFSYQFHVDQTCQELLAAINNTENSTQVSSQVSSQVFDCYHTFNIIIESLTGVVLFLTIIIIGCACNEQRGYVEERQPLVINGSTSRVVVDIRGPSLSVDV